MTALLLGGSLGVVTGLACAGRTGEAPPTAGAGSSSSSPYDVCRPVKIPPEPKYTEVLAGTGLALTDDQETLFYASWNSVHILTSMFGLEPLVTSPRPASGARVRLWISVSESGLVDRMVDISMGPGRAEVRAYAWWYIGSDLHAREEFGDKPCRELVCTDVLRACVFEAPRCLPTLLPRTPPGPPRKPLPRNLGAAMVVEYLDGARYWIGDYEHYFVDTTVALTDFIFFINGVQDLPGCVQ